MKIATYIFLSVFWITLISSTLAYAGSTQTNTSGSNTAIEGGYTSTTTNEYATGSSSNSTTNNTTNSDIKSSPPTANAPSFSAQSQDVCATGASAGVQTFGLGISGGKTFRDLNCERISDRQNKSNKVKIRENTFTRPVEFEPKKKVKHKCLSCGYNYERAGNLRGPKNCPNCASENVVYDMPNKADDLLKELDKLDI